MHALTCSCIVRMQLKLDELAAELQEMLTRSEVLGEQGDVDGSQAAATQAEAIKARRAAGLLILSCEWQARVTG